MSPQTSAEIASIAPLLYLGIFCGVASLLNWTFKTPRFNGAQGYLWFVTIIGALLIGLSFVGERFTEVAIEWVGRSFLAALLALYLSKKFKDKQKQHALRRVMPDARDSASAAVVELAEDADSRYRPPGH